jgi:cytochrome c-type biogenesis protein
MAEITLIVAFIAGVFSFLSPCVLPLIPAFLTFVAKSSLEEIKSDPVRARTKIFLSSIFFVLGFSVVFSLLGVLLQSVLSSIAFDLMNYLGYIGGAIIIFFGLTLLGVISIPALEKEYKPKVKDTGIPYFTAFLFGAAFAVGWTPCVGAVLGGILTLAITDPTIALSLMFSYSLGLGLPFLLTGLFISRASGIIKAISPYLRYLNIIFGVLLVILGILVFTGQLSRIASLDFLNQMLLG